MTLTILLRMGRSQGSPWVNYLKSFLSRCWEAIPALQKISIIVKFLMYNDFLSVQVHPSDAHPEYLPPRDRKDRSMGGFGGNIRKPHLCRLKNREQVQMVFDWHP